MASNNALEFDKLSHVFGHSHLEMGVTKAADGHDYVLAICDPSNGDNIAISLVHAAGCRKCKGFKED